MDMTTCYLTIDDSPSCHTDDMIDFLIERNIPALLFCRGDLLRDNPKPIIRAIQHGFMIGNHSFSHTPYGDFTFDQAIEDIEQCDNEIEKAYTAASIPRPGKYFRFPYLDRGDGDRSERHFDDLHNTDINENPKIQKLQEYLKHNGYTQPFKTTDHPAYKNTSVRHARDCLMTYSSYDWMLTSRHIGQWDYKNLDDLKNRIDDSDIKDHHGNIFIFHDQDETFETFKSLIDHMILKGYEFLSYDNN